MLTDEMTYGVAGGSVLVHYAATGPDRADLAFVTEVATTAEAALTVLLARGFRRPRTDGAAGGDERIDLYLRDLQSADGNAGVDSCTGGTCVGYAVAENDFSGYSYSSLTEAIRAVVPHELFHLVQYAYSDDQPVAWNEGTAVWAVEHLYGDGSGDFERFLRSFLERNFRPFERPGGGFGDGYPYGSALWRYFLEQRYDANFITDAWAACSTEPALDAVHTALVARGSDLETAWTEFTRWNWFTGARTAGGSYPAGAVAWPSVTIEDAIADVGMIYIEGMSSRYVPMRVTGENQRITITPGPGTRLAAWLLPADGRYADGVDFTAQDGILVAPAPAGLYTVVVTGLAQNTLPIRVDLATTARPEPEPEPEPEPDGGCSTSGGGGSSALLVVGLRYATRRRRARSSR